MHNKYAYNFIFFKEYKNKKEYLTFSKYILKFYINICFRIFSLYIMNAN